MRHQTINMFHQVIRNLETHWIKYEINTFAPCHFRSRNKITIPGYENYLFNKVLACEVEDVETEFHVHALLRYFKLNV